MAYYEPSSVTSLGVGAKIFLSQGRANNVAWHTAFTDWEIRFASQSTINYARSIAFDFPMSTATLCHAVAFLHAIAFLHCSRLSRLSSFSNCGRQILQYFHCGFPVDACICYAHALFQPVRPFRRHFLITFVYVRLDHEANDASLTST